MLFLSGSSQLFDQSPQLSNHPPKSSDDPVGEAPSTFPSPEDDWAPRYRAMTTPAKSRASAAIQVQIPAQYVQVEELEKELNSDDSFAQSCQVLITN